MNKQLAQTILTVLFASAIIGVPIWDKLSPMRDCNRSIESQYGTQFAWCVGLSFSSNTRATSVTRDYILIPDCFSRPRVIMVSNVNDTEPSISESTFALFAVIFVYGSLAWAVMKSLKRNQSQIGDGSNSNINPV